MNFRNAKHPTQKLVCLFFFFHSPKILESSVAFSPYVSEKSSRNFHRPLLSPILKTTTTTCHLNDSPYISLSKSAVLVPPIRLFFKEYKTSFLIISMPQTSNFKLAVMILSETNLARVTQFIETNFLRIPTIAVTQFHNLHCVTVLSWKRGCG